MSEQLDNLIEALGREPQARLDGLEGRVWARIDALREGRRSSASLAPLWAASIIAALGAGMIGGSLAAPPLESRPMEVAAFSVDAELAPSTLLGGR